MKKNGFILFVLFLCAFGAISLSSCKKEEEFSRTPDNENSSNNYSNDINTNTDNNNSTSNPSGNDNNNNNNGGGNTTPVSYIPTVSGTIDGHEYVDLGLSVKWATMNLDANNIEDAGGYFAWGERATKTIYEMDNYSFYEKRKDGTRIFKYLGADIAGTGYDAARFRWGGLWRMPSIDEFAEIQTKCKIVWKNYKGTEGIMCTGPNGNTIFFPAVGRFTESKELVTSLTNSPWGWYWTSSYYSGDYTGNDVFKQVMAYAVKFEQQGNEANFRNSYTIRSDGFSIRPVVGDIYYGGNNGNNDNNNENTGEAPHFTNFTFTSTPNSITVKFYTDVRASSATIKYGTSEYSLSSTASGTTITNLQISATVKNLKAGTKYYFQCTAKNENGTTKSDVYPAITE